jgi:hypothetical protein
VWEDQREAFGAQGSFQLTAGKSTGPWPHHHRELESAIDPELLKSEFSQSLRVTIISDCDTQSREPLERQWPADLQACERVNVVSTSIPCPFLLPLVPGPRTLATHNLPGPLCPFSPILLASFSLLQQNRAPFFTGTPSCLPFPRASAPAPPLNLNHCWSTPGLTSPLPSSPWGPYLQVTSQ